MVKESEVQSKYIFDFITKQSRKFFEAFQINEDFLNADPIEWEVNESYIEAKLRVRKMFVVNDVSERGVALASEYLSMTTNESDFQNLLQCMEKHRKEMNLKSM